MFLKDVKVELPCIFERWQTQAGGAFEAPEA
jgi:hypothetical protein